MSICISTTYSNERVVNDVNVTFMPSAPTTYGSPHLDHKQKNGN